MEEFSELSVSNSIINTQPVSQDGQVGASRIALSGRERLVVEMMGSGMHVGAIAKELKLSVKTVSTYRARALTKLGFKTNDELVQYLTTNRPADNCPADA